MDLSIVILNYRTRGLLRQCLKGLVKTSSKYKREIIVVDNASHDGTADMIAREFPGVRCIESSTNCGYGPGNNIGIRAAKGRYIAIMNPDIVVLDDSHDRLIEYLDAHADVGIVAPQLKNPNGSIQFSCYRFPSPMIPIYRRTPLGKLSAGKRAVASYLMSDWDHAEEREVDWVLGGCFMMQRNMIDQIGLFDERFFLYFDDTDICRRAWEHGWKVVYFPSASFVHLHRRESAGALFKSLMNKVTRIHIVSGVRYFQKYWKKPLPRPVEDPKQ